MHQLIWDRFVNTHGGMGHNLPCDLHNEHVNKALNGAIRHMGANFSQNVLTNVARSITYMVSVSARFDQQCKVIESSMHTTCEDFDDVNRVVGVVMHQNLWEIHKGRKHSKFKVLSTDPLINLDRKKLEQWMEIFFQIIRNIKNYRKDIYLVQSLQIQIHLIQTNY